VLLGFKQLRNLVTVRPTIENILSEGVDVAEMLSKNLAN